MCFIYINRELNKKICTVYESESCFYLHSYFGTLMAPQWRKVFGSAEKMLAALNRDDLLMVLITDMKGFICAITLT